MGASRHRGYGLHRIGSRHSAAWADRNTGRNVRRVRTGASALSPRFWRLVSLVGLGLIAGAVLHGPLAAQVKDTIQKKRDTTITIPVPPHADSLLRDSLARRDSLKRAALIADSVKAPIAHSELPTELSIGRRLHWNRD